MKKTIYLSIYEDIRKKIIDNTYPYNTRIPSKRTSAQDYQASLITVEHAYDLLEEEGYINAVERKGYVVIYRENDFFPITREKTEISNTAVMDNTEIFPYSTYAKTIRKVISDYGKNILISRENQGLYEFRKAIARYLARCRNIYVEPDQIVITAGAGAAYSLIVSILGRFRIYGIETPSYETIEKIYKSEGVRLDHLKMGATGILSKELERTPASVLHVTPFSSYPTGVTADASKRREYITWAKTHSAFIVEDDYASEYSPLTKIQETLFSQEPDHSVIYMNSFSRTICPALHISYIVLPSRLKDKFLKTISYRSCGVSSVDQYVVAELINNGSFERHLNRVKRQMRKQK
jgi:GntR family transcriptional regulator/MocR family aminotransferase